MWRYFNVLCLLALRDYCSPDVPINNVAGRHQVNMQHTRGLVERARIDEQIKLGAQSWTHAMSLSKLLECLTYSLILMQ